MRQENRVHISKRVIDGLTAGEIAYDDEVIGFVARKLPSGATSYGYRYRTNGKQRWLGLGLHGSITPDEARKLAKRRAGEVAAERDPVAEREEKRAAEIKVARANANTVNAILDAFLARYVSKLRTAYEIERTFNVYVRPRIGATSIYQVTRRQIVEMLDEIEDENGAVMADRVLAYVRKAFNWQATRDDQFSPPIVRGMARTKPKERARQRILTDDEIREVWAALEAEGVPQPFREVVRTLLLTAQRRGEVANMTRDEISGAIWTIPPARSKNGIANVVPLTDGVIDLIGHRKGFIFSSNGGKQPFNGYSKAKTSLDEAIAKGRKQAKLKAMPHWTLHDLRRTARSLMSRAGVQSDIAERVLNHVLHGVRGVYDRHSYSDEKRQALEKLAGLLGQILNPPHGNVVSLATGGRA
jgi:integrase